MPFSTNLPPEALFVLEKLTSAGFEAYAVGGCVRDTLLGRAIHDWDVTTSAPARRTRALFDRTVPTGERFGTVTVLTEWGNVEVTTFRRDGAYLDARRPETVEFTGSLAEDLARRDFTVNAMAMDLSGRIIDLFGGREDLKRRVIRCVGDPERRFSEDALRMLRAVRFSAQLGFGIDERTLKALKGLSGLAGKLSAERVLGELTRTLATDHPEAAASMIEYGLLERFISSAGEDVPVGRLRCVPAETRLCAFAVMCARAGRAASAGELLRALRATARQVRDASGAEALSGSLSPSPAALRAALCLHPEAQVLIAAGAMGFYDAAREEIAKRRYVTVPELAVSGAQLRDLGFAGPQISAALRALALAVTAGETENTREALMKSISEARGEEFTSKEVLL